jgi:hypothetical protein
MPDFYQRTARADTHPTWPFKDAVPDGVLVYLGTNDYNKVPWPRGQLGGVGLCCRGMLLLAAGALCGVHGEPCDAKGRGFVVVKWCVCVWYVRAYVLLVYACTRVLWVAGGDPRVGRRVFRGLHPVHAERDDVVVWHARLACQGVA